MAQELFGPNESGVMTELKVYSPGLIGLYPVADALGPSALTISSGGTTSGAVDLAGRSTVALEMPATWDGGNITIQGCSTLGGTYLDVYDSTGTIVTVTAVASHVIGLTGTHLQAVSSLRFIKLRATSAVAADRAINLIAKG